jgi:hypothetical protein
VVKIAEDSNHVDGSPSATASTTKLETAPATVAEMIRFTIE